ncbi:MAG: alpha-mannosidase [Porphyromonadaceae bacterium]|nr:alpha-mannosidase [Porphyromonadaceae bacterium]
MCKKICLSFLGILAILSVNAQPANVRGKYDISKEKVLYTVGYSHLDSEWNWDYTATIDECIRNVMTENFYLFDKYPDYVFNFTGSRRYQMMKEYYPEMFERVRDYIRQGRWYVSGSSVDEGEVNISSSESLIRQVLYGNNYFRKEFGKESKDYMLPDCFGFLANMPTIWNHCGLLGFSTQKLTWQSAAGVPFNVGVWNGPDGKGVVAALNATNYVGRVVPRLDLDSAWNERLESDNQKYGILFDYRYYGVGDQGGAPRENDVKNAVGSLNNKDSKFKVVLTSSDQMYQDITPEIRKKLPVYSGDLLLIEHSAGSMTSQSYMKRQNRKNELLALSAEQLAAAADWKGRTSYPFDKLNASWDLVLGSQFHDILPGTSIPKAYEYAWNDEFIAANGFAEVLKNSVNALAGDLNTQVKGRSIVVYNPVASDREDVVTAEMSYQQMPENVQVYDAKGKAVPTQILGRDGQRLKFIFLAKVPSVGLAVFDVREAKNGNGNAPGLKVSNTTLENDFYKLTLGDNGDIVSLYDKQVKRELLSKPASLEFQEEKSYVWPAWNMTWKDRQKAPVDYMNHSASLKVIEQGPVRVAIEIQRSGRNSTISQVVSLSTGEAGRRVEISNQADWQSKGVSLKASFPLSAENGVATYNLGVGTIQRGNNDSLKFEVPAKEWFDLTDKSGKYGVSILEDCKYGSDKPDNNTLRLTLLYTPEAKDRYRYQDTQDWGVHQFRYGIYGHKGSWQDGSSQMQGQFFNQPMIAFEADRHAGKMGAEVSLLSVKSPQVGVMAFKKMEEGNYYLVRVNELLGKDLQKTSISFPGKIEDAYEVNGQEQKMGPVDFKGNEIEFGLTHYTIRSFAVKLAAPSSSAVLQSQVELPYNADVLSYDTNRDDGSFSGRASIDAALIPQELVSEGIRFELGSKEDGQNNALSCKGQEISLPEGTFNRIYILAAATEDTKGDFTVGGNVLSLPVQSWTGYIGQFYNRDFELDGVTVRNINRPYVKNDNIAWFASHYHHAYPSKNMTYKYSYVYKYALDLPAGTAKITLPKNDKIKILAMSVAKEEGKVEPLQPLYDDFANSPAVSLR